MSVGMCIDLHVQATQQSIIMQHSASNVNYYHINKFMANTMDNWLPVWSLELNQCQRSPGKESGSAVHDDHTAYLRAQCPNKGSPLPYIHP